MQRAIWSPFISGRPAMKTLDKCKEALDGILFVDEAYSLAGKARISATRQSRR